VKLRLSTSLPASLLEGGWVGKYMLKIKIGAVYSYPTLNSFINTTTSPPVSPSPARRGGSVKKRG